MAENMKVRIIDASLNLFNQIGSHKITTNHIIDKLGISPGTFYYHFRNKEEIIRSIFGSISADFASVFRFEPQDSAAEMMESITDNLKLLFSLYNKYSFFYNEISSLLDRDEILKNQYLENYQLKAEKLKQLFYAMEQEGVFVKGFSSSDRIDHVIDSIWILSDYWVTFLKTTGRPGDENVIAGYKNYLLLLLPYLEKQYAVAARKFL